MTFLGTNKSKRFDQSRILARIIVGVVLLACDPAAIMASSGPSISLLAYSQDGKNTGNAQLGMTVTIVPTVSNSSSTTINWTLQGPGSISNTGVYTAPAAMPSPNTATVTATLAFNTSVSTSYQMTLVNGIPSIAHGVPKTLNTASNTVVTVTGTGFVSGMTITGNGANYPVTFQSSTQVQITIPTTETGTGNINLVATNPTPMGGASAAYVENIAVPTITFVAYSQDGKNTGNAQLGTTVTITPTVSGTGDTALTWTLQGPGSLSNTGVYTVPATMPSTNTATVTAALTNNPAVSTSYTMTLVNAIPSISHAIPKPINTAQTNTVTLQGTSFAPGMTVTGNGQSYAVTYQSPTSALVQIPVSETATGTINLIATNPTPGGGASAAYAETIAVPTITFVAYSQDGHNTGNAQLGMNVTITPTVSGTGDTALTWTLQGPGSISNTGVYSAPASMPSTTTATVTATLTNNTSVSTSYTMTLVNPVATISTANPKPLNLSTTNAVTLTGTGFIPGMTVTGNGQALSVTYQSPTSALVQIPASTTASGNLSLVVTTPTPGGGTSAAYTETYAVPTISFIAYSQDGKNTGNAQLGTTVTIVPTVSGTSDTTLTWSLQGPGSISNTGVYTVPATMPSTTTATVTAALTDYPSISTTYSMTLVNAIPSISHAIPKPLNTAQTTTVTLQGTSFAPGMTVTGNGQSYAVTYQSPTSALIQITVGPTDTGTINLVATNPTPGGGASAAYAETIAVPAISFVAYSQDGKNTGNAQLGTNVTIVPTVSGSGDTTLTWTLQGPGSLSNTGVYSVPATMPSTTTATVTAALTLNPSISTTYTMTLVNPVAAITSATPSTLRGTSNSVTLTGTGFVPGSVVTVNGTTIPTTFQNPTTVTGQITVASGQSAPLSVAVQNPVPGGGTSPVFSLPVAVPGITSISPATLPVGPYTLTITGANFTSTAQAYINGESVTTTYVSPTQLTVSGQVAPWSADPVVVTVAYSSTYAPAATFNVPVVNPLASQYDAAARFSMQAAFGPRPDVVLEIQQMGIPAYLNEQFTEAASTFNVTPGTYQSKSEFFIHALTGTNLLRQRVAFALENFIAVAIPNDASAYQEGVPWQTIMESDAFGNFRDLMTDITLNSTMGVWLNLGNNWASTDPTVHPNQNYARELMQLFTMGTNQLNDDGSLVTDSSGNPVPTYDDNTIFDLSRALTGWALPAADSSPFTTYGVDFGLPMQANDSQHDHGQKTLFGSIVLPAGQTIQQDLTSALDAVFNQTTVPPYISKLLIQHLVKSNPTPGYVQRISSVFENDGNGVRGNLQAVVSAILLDAEARCGDDPTCAASDANLATEGHLQDPVVSMLSIMSGLQIEPIVPYGQAIIDITSTLGEDVWRPASVFSFYSPSYMVPGSQITAPEFQIYDGNFATQRSQVLVSILEGTQSGINTSYRSTDWLLGAFSSVPDILTAVNHMYYHGQMPANTQAAIASYCQGLSGLSNQQTTALYLALDSDSFQVTN